jgi:peroxiredoxin (alkyl hydroperoxide reductase subunit C)
VDENFQLSSLRGRHVVLFFYPLDFTFVCPSEILAFDEALDRFQQRGAEVVGISVDSHYTHLVWRNTAVQEGGIGPVRFPLVSDLTKEIARDYGVLLDDGVALRALFLVDREGIVRHAVVNDLPLGRSVGEALRMLDALRFHEERGEVCPANWEQGEAGIEPSRRGVINYLSRFAPKTPPPRAAGRE